MTTPTDDRADKNAVFQQMREQMMQPSLDRIQQDLGFDIPVESIPLPSKGKIYGTDSVLCNKETVEIRSMVAKDEDILTSRGLIKKGTVITELIKSCLMDKSIMVPEMLAGDRNALMVAIRITGYGQEYKVGLTCPTCEAEYEHEFDLAALPIKFLEIEPASPNQNAFRFQLPVSKKNVVFKFINGQDEEEIMLTNERKKKSGMTSDNLVTARLGYSVIAVDEVTDKNRIAQYMRNMPARDSLALRSFIDKHEPGIEMKQVAVCTACGYEAEVNVPLGPTFFWPNA